MGASDTKTAQKESASSIQRTLLIIVIMMGIALIGGSALLVGKIVNKNKAAKTVVSAECEPQHYALAEGETALVLAVEGNIATIEVRRVGQKDSILLRQIDMCSGAVVGALRIQ